MMIMVMTITSNEETQLARAVFSREFNN